MTPEVSVPMVLLAGITSFASPCFLPVVPVFVGYMAGSDAMVSAQQDGRRRLVAATNATVFMAAFGAVFIALWALVGLIGWAAGDLREPMRIVGGAVIILLGLHTAGWIHLPLLDRTLRVGYSPDTATPPTLRRSFLLGLAFGAGWSPCIGPVLGAVLGLAVNTTSVGSGVLLLVVYSLGLGLPFVLVCTGANGLTQQLRWFTRHHRPVAVVTGLVLMIVGFLMISDLFSRLAGLTATVL